MNTAFNVLSGILIGAGTIGYYFSKFVGAIDKELGEDLKYVSIGSIGIGFMIIIGRVM